MLKSQTTLCIYQIVKFQQENIDKRRSLVREKKGGEEAKEDKETWKFKRTESLANSKRLCQGETWFCQWPQGRRAQRDGGTGTHTCASNTQAKRPEV